jgi:hypothetical protein
MLKTGHGAVRTMRSAVWSLPNRSHQMW